MTKRRLSSLTVHLGLLIILCFFILPFIWMLLSSFQPQENLARERPIIEFSQWYVNYQELFENHMFVRALKNTVVVTIFTTLFSVVFACCAAYVLARFRFRGKSATMFAVYAIQLGPAVAFLIPIFMIMNKLRLIDTRLGLILTVTAFTIPVSMWILLGFFKSIPREMEEAGVVDGCGRLGVFFRIILPMARPGFVSAAIVTFIMVWGELLLALPLTLSKAVPLTVFASSFSGVHFTNFGGAAATAVISSLPTIIIMLIFRKYLLRGLLEGAVKG